uniref:Uncharacterized protein n=1 Tax=Vannella robusta TaxID=1487602 RepID=A0A7S4IPT4_9EUKA|mmetsp:Transcript_6439/g.7937  ORF Transcript_6439/g.7937 Transcript_6439/m.7937 type:complete len:109 (+) Transcript_6439:212-538(+)
MQSHWCAQEEDNNKATTYLQTLQEKDEQIANLRQQIVNKELSLTERVQQLQHIEEILHNSDTMQHALQRIFSRNTTILPQDVTQVIEKYKQTAEHIRIVAESGLLSGD